MTFLVRCAGCRFSIRVTGREEGVRALADRHADSCTTDRDDVTVEPG